MTPTVSSSSPYRRPTAGAHERRTEFCTRFKDERQRRNRSIIAISAVTKLQVSLLEAFERGDVSRWPKGIYRRAFFRDYVTAIGLPADPHLAEFIELFPDAELPVSMVVSQPAPPAAQPSEVMTTSFRITLAEDASPWTMRAPNAAHFRLRVRLQQAGATAADLALVLLVAFVLSRWMGSLWSATAIVACVYYSLCTALLGRTLASTLLIRGDWMATAYSATSSAATSLLRWIQLRLRETRARAPELAAFLERAARNRPSFQDLRPSLQDRLSRLQNRLSRQISRLPRIPSFRIHGRRDRELAELRRQRLEVAERPAEEISEVVN